MAKVVDMHVRFSVIDGMSAPMGNMLKSVDAYNGRLASMDNSLKSISSSTNSYLSTLTKLSGAYKAAGTLINAFNASFSGFFEYYKSFQTNAVGISGILSSMVTLNGKTLEWNDSMNISKDIMSKLRIQALQTAATSEDLIETFRALLGPGLASKMSIDEVMKFTTVGVNAVKSLGLPTNQLIQELRDLVQGGIRAASSTLATALGLTDADINKAKQSSEGLFKFLMKRMEGFARSTDETANTIYGQIEIAKEAIKSIGATAGADLFEGVGSALKTLNSVLLTRGENGLLEVNPEVIGTVKEVTAEINTAVKFAANFGKQIYESFNILAWGVGIAYGVPKILGLAANGVQAIGDRIAKAVDMTVAYKNAIVEAEEKFRAEAQASLVQRKKEFEVEEAISAQKREQAKILETTNKLAAARNGVQYNEDYTKHVIEQYQKLGFSEKQARDKLMEFLRAMQSADPEVRMHAQLIMHEAMQYADNSEKVAKNIGLKEKLYSVIGKSVSVLSAFSGSLSTVAFGLMAVSDADNQVIRDLSNTLFAVDAVITGFGGLNQILQTSIGWWKGLSAAARATTLTLISAVPLALAAGAAIYSASKGGGQTATETGVAPDGNDISDMFNPDGTLKSNQEILGKANISKEIRDIAYWEKIKLQAEKNLDDDNAPDKIDYSSGIATKFQPTEKNKGGAGGSKTDNALKKLEQAVKKYESLQDKLAVDIKKNNLTYSSLEEKNAEILKQENAWAEEIKALAESGLEDAKIKELTALKEQAIAERRIAAQRDFNKKMNQLNLDAAQNTMLLGGTQEQQYKAVDNALQAQKTYYDELLAIEGLAADKRIELERERASIIKQIRDNDMMNYKTAWQATLQDLATQQINYGESIKSVFSTIESAGTSLLSSTESFGTKIKTFFSDVTSSILSEMSKIIMKGLITNAILGIFGMGGGKINTSSNARINSVGSYANQFADMNKAGGPTFGFGQYLPGRANGGLANGWTIVGEKGPELVNFSQPGRVYTAQQTANALGGGNVNIKIDLRNESGQQLEAQQTSSSFDGESYVIGVVLKAISTNKGGLRTVLRGV